MRNLKFAIYAIKKNIQNSAELRTSFVMNVVGMAINNCSLLLLWIFFIRAVGGIGGWQQADIVGLEGFTGFAFGIAFTFFYGLGKIEASVASGGFDRFLLSPKNLLVRIATSALGVSSIGDIVFGILCLVAYAILAHLGMGSIAIMLMGCVIASVATTAALLLSQLISFFMMDASSISRSLFEMFLTPALFAGGAFQGWMRFIFTFIIPALVMGTLPVEAVKAVSWPQIFTLAILAGLFMALSIVLFYKGVRRYESASLGGFGS